MKNIYLLLASAAIVGNSFAQNVPSKKYPAFGTESNPSILQVTAQTSERSIANAIPSKLNFRSTKSVQSKGSTLITDTLDSHFVGTPILYTVTGGGYVAGHNTYGDLSKMQKFDAAYGVVGTGTITKVILAVGAKSGSSTSTIDVKIWADNGGTPGAVIASVSVPFSSLDTSSANGLTTVTFPNPVTIPSNKVFYAGIGLTYSGSDAVGLLTTTDGDFPAAITHTWEEWSDNGFYSLGSTNSFGLDVAYAIFPVVEINAPTPPQPELVYYSQNFDAGIPSTYSIIDVDGNTVNTAVAGIIKKAWSSAIASGSTDSSAMSTSWYTPAGASDDWMITEAIVIPDTATSVFLSWDAEAIDPAFRDGYEVYISNTNQTIAAAQANPVLFSTLAENSDITTRKVNISSYKGDTVYVAFRNNSTDMFLLSIDNIKVYRPNPFDMAVSANTIELTGLSEYTSIPSRHLAVAPAPVKVKVLNNGAVTPDTARVIATIKNGTNVIYADTLLLTSGLPTANSEIEFTMNKLFDAPSAAGSYNLTLTSEVSISASEDLSNNTLESVVGKYSISDTTYSRDDNATGTTSLSIGGGLTGHLGMVYDIVSRDTLTSVTAVLRGVARAGRTASVSVWEYNNAPASAPLAASKVYNASAPGTYNFILSGGVDLTPGKYLVTIDELDSTINIATTTSIFTPGTVWIKSPGIASNAWNNVENFGANFARTFFIRPNFGNVVVVGINNQKALNAEVNVYPNPNEGVFNVSINSATINEYAVTITDMLGRVVESHTGLPNGEFNFDLSNQPNGMYFVRVNSGDAVTSLKLVLNK